MPSPKYVRKTYAIHYDDSTYMIYDLTKEDFLQLEDAVLDNKHAIKLSVGILKLRDIRSIVEQKPAPKEEKKENKSGTPEMDVISMAWLKEQESLLNQYGEDDDDELEGGRFS